MPISKERLRVIAENVEAQAGPVVEAIKEAMLRIERVVLLRLPGSIPLAPLTIMDDCS